MYKEDCSSLFLETYHNHVRSKMLVIPFPNVAKSIVITIIKGIIGLLFKLRGTAIGTFAISYPWIWWGMLHSYAVVDTRVPLYATLCPSWSIWVCIREFSANTLSTLVKYETYSEKSPAPSLHFFFYSSRTAFDVVWFAGIWSVKGYEASPVVLACLWDGCPGCIVSWPISQFLTGGNTIPWKATAFWLAMHLW